MEKFLFEKLLLLFLMLIITMTYVGINKETVGSILISASGGLIGVLAFSMLDSHLSRKNNL